MSASTTIPTPTPTLDARHMSASQVADLCRYVGESDAMLGGRVRVVSALVADGISVKTITDDMAAEHRRDDAVPAVSSTILGFASAAGWAVETMGATVKGQSAAYLANLYRAAKRRGIKGFRGDVRDLATILADDATVSDRLAALSDLADDMRAVVIPTPEPSRRAATVDGGDTDGAAVDTVAIMTADTHADALAALRAVTAYLVTGGSWSADLASAAAQFADAASSARKRDRTAAAQTAQARA